MDLKQVSDHNLDMEIQRQHLLQNCEGPSGCEGKLLYTTASQTAYPLGPSSGEPNKDLLLCPSCSAMYTEAIEAQWAEYYSGLLC